MRYQMVEDRFVAEQTHEIINLEHALADAEMKLPEKFLVMSIVDKFPKSWENFGMTLKHQKGRLSLDDLMIAISIEEEHRNQTHKMPAITGKTVSMGNSSTAEVLGIGSVDLKFPSGRILSLKRVHHVPTIRRNIISGSVIVREGYELAFKFNKVVIQQFGIFVETPPYSPSSNGVTERKNRTFKDMINSLLLTSGLPKYLWGESLNTACHILNRVPLKHNTSTPFELWKGRKPSLKYFRVWGCLAKVLVPEHKRKKLGPKTVDAVFLGYVETSYALRFLVIKSEIPSIEVNTIVEFRDAVFLEDVFPMKTEIPSSVSLDDSLASTSIPEHVEKMTNMGVNPNTASLTHEESDVPRRSKRARVVKDFGSDFVTYNIEDDPVTFKDAMASLEAKQWKEAVKSEMDSIVSNGTWMDVKTAFLYGELDEEIYMDQPEGFVAHGNERKVCKLVKSLYGLKQAPKQWHEKFDQTILAFGFTDMGEADVILGIKLIRSTDGIAISQSHYVEKILEKFGYQNNRIAKTPYDSSVALFKNESGVSVAQLRYSQIIGSLQYLANGTRPDISFSVSKLARYTSCPETHWGALDRVLRYLKGTVSLAIHYSRFPAILEGYSDASWIAKKLRSNGCSGYVFTLGGGAVSWKSAKQTLITRSTFEAELCALDTTGTEEEWLFGLLSQLPIVSQPLPPIAVHCDSQTTIAKVRSRKYNQKTKRHIQVRLKSIRALVSDRVIGIDFVGTKDNVADPLTKGLDLSQVNKSRLGMGLKTHQ
ncbi:UNVERIFIED_CONTAM: Retrovirus-related Pol polyprotein from transposon TNT 1-94 [Sesamum radiatum]|uniref:Retrovirus-related Pol polyprotein from transposon TNT 1-94 n=1 Tax=Sesamum radiatum TaxID=300843 RepID=A0AAW2LBQ7_SESRA